MSLPTERYVNNLKNDVILTIFELLWRKLMKTKLLITLLLALGLLTACSEMNPYPMDMS
jgi:hypothetical protein